MADKEKEVKKADYKKRPKHKKIEPYNRKKAWKEMRYITWGQNYIKDGKLSGSLRLITNSVLGATFGYTSISLELKDAETAKEFARLCKPIIIKHLFSRNDHENFESDF